MQIIGCVGVTYWFNCYLLENYRLCRCNVLIEMLLLSKHRLSRCSVLIVMLILLNVDCVDVGSWLKCCCLQVIGCVSGGLWLECYCFLIIGCVVCCVVVGILLLESFRLCWCNALTSLCYYYSSLTFEVEEVGCTYGTRTSSWVIVE